MLRLRHLLGPVAAAWIFFQVATVTATPVAFWIVSSEALVECTCAHGDHDLCPMHHKPAPGSTICVLRSAADSDMAVISLLFGAVGLVPVPTQIATLVPHRAVALTDIAAASPRPAPPDPPPPRA